MTSIGSSSSVEATEPAVARAQLAIAVASYNDAASVGHVASAVDAALARDLPDRSSRVLLADAGSTDGTIARLREALGARAVDLVEVPYPRLAEDLLHVPYHGLPGRPRALRAILTAARELDVQGCVVIDGSLTTIAPSWITALAGPVLRDECDYVSPFYARHAYEGALTKGLLYPLLRALYGVRLRQPAATEFACSRGMLELFLEEDLWDREGADTGIDVWLTTLAAVSKLKLGEAALGPRGHHSRGEAALDLRTVVGQIAGAAFADLEGRAEVWQRVRNSSPVPLVSDAAPLVVDTPQVEIESWVEAFRLGYRELREIWSWVLPPKAIIDLRKLAAVPIERFHLDDALWARIVYDFALAHRLRVMPRDHLLGSLTPLYLGWLASFARQVRELPPDAQETRIEQLALAFESQKPYLVSRWRWPEKFRT